MFSLARVILSIMAPKTKFSQDEKVLCYHHDIPYEAKILDVLVNEKEGKVKYAIHYQGWHKRWDDVVNEDRVLKHNEQGLQKQKELMREAKEKSKATKKGNRGTPKTSAPPTPAPLTEPKPADVTKTERISRSSTPSVDSSTRHKLVEDKTSNDTPTGPSSRSRNKYKTAEPQSERIEPEPEVKCHINIRFPENLKPHLVDDHNCINQQHMLIRLPADKNVNCILDDYYQARTAEEKDCQDTILEITKGLRDYFNATLGTQLLYKFERAQYSDILREIKKDKRELVDVYGAIHLLRLFCKIGSMMSYVDMEMRDREQSIIVTHIHDFLKWMSKCHTALFDSSLYYSAPPDYLRKAMI